MDPQFERSHCIVGSRTITLTSWFDDARQVWQTSAPSYMHLPVVTEASHVSSTSRKAGLAHLAQALEKHFAPMDLAHAQELMPPRSLPLPKIPVRPKSQARAKELPH